MGRQVQRGTLIALTGDLGAGKTQLVKGIARGLGSRARVHSPTFAIVNLYEDGRLPLAHLDLYRLETPEQLRGAGIEEFLQPEGVAVIEWAERLFVPGADGGAALIPESRVPGNFVRIHIEVVDETTRRIRHEDPGS
ncbi:MAG: tRNA (adenosine(37)-N6)-threonylcarbamoyltransferase complex ATPase subunit type 1 TsaE [Verrucomicrobia bacterium]|nr:tRNA (adenosine(37)-N6)-threonylcarbamoyltransferase complex ATPase subunit type 1 TsaE [Verrucomicrobiota bacterium]